jgi:type I restriction enzyme M protein
MLDAELKSKINKLWDKFWSGGISNPLTAIEQISYLLFMKRLEDEDILRQQNAKLTKEKYISVFDGNNDCKWSIWTEYSSDKILEHVRSKVFPFLKKLGSEDSLYNQYMQDAVFVIPTPSMLIEAVKIINELKIKEQNKDTQGDIYEYLLSELTTAGKNGQFRTPRHIIKMMVELLNPKFGETICDPACGTAGFLVASYEHILKQNTSKDLVKKDELGTEYGFKGDKLNSTQWDILRTETFHGFDIDPTMVRIALMNMMMHGIGHPNIKQINSVSTRYTESSQYDIVLANPPFKGSIDESELSDQLTIKTLKTEILFLELMNRVMRTGGKCAVIVPDGVLFGGSKAHKQIRQMLLQKCRLDAVISMPSGIFKPYAGVSTAVLVFTKGEETNRVWFYEMTSDGFSLDDKRTLIDGKGDIPDIVEKFKRRDKEDFSKRNAKCFFVPLEEIEQNNFDLSISKYKEIEHEEVKYEKPEFIKKKILELEEEIIKIGKEIDI